jgi:hypothetical protein
MASQEDAEKAEHDTRACYFNFGDPDEPDVPLFTGFAALRRKQDTKSIGAGIVRILRHKQTLRQRILMRNMDATALLLNHYLLPEMVLTIVDKTRNQRFLFKATTYADPSNPEMAEWLLRFRDPGAAEEFRKAYCEAIRANHILREQGK